MSAASGRTMAIRLPDSIAPACLCMPALIVRIYEDGRAHQARGTAWMRCDEGPYHATRIDRKQQPYDVAPLIQTEWR